MASLSSVRFAAIFGCGQFERQAAKKKQTSGVGVLAELRARAIHHIDKHLNVPGVSLFSLI
jgi:hypothetical protein